MAALDIGSGTDGTVRSITGAVAQTQDLQAHFLEPGNRGFDPLGIRLHGNDSRKEDKQNFQLRFRSQYGVGKLNYKLFEDRDIDEYNSLLLKGGSEDWNYAGFRDELATGIVHGTTALYTQARKPVVLYLGGQYWGVYYLRERFSDEYVASHLNVSKESVDLLFMWLYKYWGLHELLCVSPGAKSYSVLTH